MNSTYASSSDLGTVYLYQGSTLVGTANFNGVAASGGYYLAATSSINAVNLTQNSQTTFTLKGNIATIGQGDSGSSGHEILVSLANAQGTSGNTSVNSGTPTPPSQGSGVAIFNTFPSQVTQSNLPTTGVFGDDKLIEFAITANSTNELGIEKLHFSFASSTDVTIATPALYYGSAAGSESTLVANSGSNATTYYVADQAASTTLTTPLEIPAGQTWYFLLKAQSLGYTGSANTYNITTQLVGDSTDLSPNTIAGATATSTYNFVWSPNSTTTSGVSSNDWANGFGVSGLPSFGISQTRSN